MRLSIIIVVCILVGNVPGAYSQLSPNRSLQVTKLKAVKYVFDSSFAMFHVKFGYLPTLPPYSTSLSFEQFMAYTAIDSVLRAKRGHEIKTWIDGLTSWDDTTRYLARYLYAVIDDDPALFTQFMSETALRKKVWNVGTTLDTPMTYNSTASGRYLTALSFVIEELKHRVATLWPVSSMRKPVRNLLDADIIVRGTVTSIDSTPSTRTAIPMMSYAVTMTVSDTIKGKRLPHVSARVFPPGYPEHMFTVPPQTNTLRFEYLPITYPPFGELSSDGYTVVRDSVFSDAKGYFRMQVGQEAIMFLRFMNHMVDDNFDYYNLRVDSFVSNGALAILPGDIVHDAGMVWSPNTQTSYNVWRQIVQTLIDDIRD